MKVFIILTIIFSYNSYALDLIKDGHSYLLLGPCEEAAKEISYFSTKEIQCECLSECRTKVSEHLPRDIQKMLEIKNTREGGPNCWNSVLFSLGLHQGLHFSEVEMMFWLRSPLCHKREGEPVPGDLINVRVIEGNETSQEANEWHTYRLLSPKIAFNKSSPAREDPYELTLPQEYLDRESIPTECRFVDIQTAIERKCELTSEAYYCKNLDTVLTSLDADIEGRDVRQKLAYLSECSQISVLGESKNHPLEDFSTLAEALKLMALQKINVPDKKQTPKGIQDLIKSYLKETCSECEPSKLESWENFIPILYFYSSPEMDIEALHPTLQKVILEARDKKLYSTLPLKERLMWINVYLTSKSLDTQFRKILLNEKNR